MINSLLAEIQNEAKNTRKMLERVPAESMDWQPHPKSMTLERLANHIAEIPKWLTVTLTTTELDLSQSGERPTPSRNAVDLVEKFERLNNEAIATLKSATEASLHEIWTMRNGEQLILQLPRHAVIRSMVMNHLVHHRGQLSVFLRLLNVPIPGMYGPSADEAF